MRTSHSGQFQVIPLIEGLSLELGSEHRFGETVNPDTGSSIPVALLPDLPAPDISHLALTKVLFIQELYEDLEIFFGKMDTLEFDTNGFAYGNGRERFFSTAFNYDPIATKTIPFSTLGAGISVLRDGERFPILYDAATRLGTRYSVVIPPVAADRLWQTACFLRCASSKHFLWTDSTFTG